MRDFLNDAQVFRLVWPTLERFGPFLDTFLKNSDLIFNAPASDYPAPLILMLAWQFFDQFFNRFRVHELFRARYDRLVSGLYLFERHLNIIANSPILPITRA